MHVSNITNTRMQEENDSKNTLMNDIVACKTRTVIYLFIYLFFQLIGKNHARVAMGKNRAGAYSK